MCVNTCKRKGKGLALDNIAQVGTNPSLSAIQKRARSKFLSYRLVKALANLDSPLKSSYIRSLSCCNEVEVENGVAKSKYCKNRWCFTCARIKTAVLIDKYKDSLDNELPDAYFVTLTIPNCKAGQLRYKVDEMYQEFKRISEKHKKRFQRGQEKQKLKCVTKLECTYNAKRHDFHPHFHIIVNSKESAKYLKSEWLSRFPSTKSVAQDIRKADEGSKLELFKYTAKVMSQIEEFEKGNDSQKPIFVEALDVIYRALRKKRTLRAYGFRLEISEDFNDEDLKAVTKVKAEDGEYEYFADHKDWINKETGEFLSLWIATSRERKFVKNIIPHSGRKFLKKWLTVSDIIDLVENYRLEISFRSKRRLIDYFNYSKLGEYELGNFEQHMFKKVKSMNFDDDFQQFRYKLHKFLESKR